MFYEIAQLVLKMEEYFVTQRDLCNQYEQLVSELKATDRMLYLDITERQISTLLLHGDSKEAAMGIDF